MQTTHATPIADMATLGANAPLSVAVVDADGRLMPGPRRGVRAEVFAALGYRNATANVIRSIRWAADSSWQSDLFGQIQIRPWTGTKRMPFGGGLPLG